MCLKETILATPRHSGALFPLTLALSLREREYLSTGRDGSLAGEHFPAPSEVLPLPKGEGRGVGEQAIGLTAPSAAALVTRSTHLTP